MTPASSEIASIDMIRADATSRATRSDQDSKRPSRSNVLLVPIFGGIFALLFYIITLSGTLEGAAFPTYTVLPFSDPATTADLQRFFAETYPATGEDFANLTLWAFAAGFSERLVPNIITQKVGPI